MRAALDEIDGAAGRLDAEVLARRRDSRWSVAQILEHLRLAFTLNRATLDKALASGELRGRRPRLRERVGRLLVVDIGYFPRVGAPERTRPGDDIPPDRILDATRDALIGLDAALARVADRFGNGVRVANHPYFAGLTVREWRKFHWRHTRHHMRQVRTRVQTG